ncbi:trk system potassium uptake protein TrkH [Oikeobacillus pervagus]|uniref:Trk system potassium uptake protein TrkH n=2 Tax=Oikeobacillus pervagus TaxID=1325931 RepID=A0AAJ1SZA4_9BACI|nr:trk system potassium uptake protein TrkH [Oikeobacillus pervagus]
MKSLKISPSYLLFIIYASFITIGAVLLKLPISTNTPISWMDALFTSTSAMTVTGLGVVDVSKEFTTFGQVIIALLIQTGGLGIMSFAVLIFIMLGKKIGLKERLIIQQALNQIQIGGVIRLVKYIFIFSLSIEVSIMIFLAAQWIPEFGWGRGSFYSFFHAISAFNNAGFALWSDGLSRYIGNPIINIGITTLIILGGLGYTVLIEVWNKQKWRQFSLHTKIMLSATLVINLVAFLIIFLLEYTNEKTIGLLPLSDKLWASYFQAVTTRTAGFNTIEIGSLDESTLFVFLILMFIGAGSGSTGGGIKLTTFIVISLAVITFIRGKHDIHIFKRSIQPLYILKVLAIASISIFVIAIAVFILNITEDAEFLPILFEVISAFSTVGLSMGITSSLTFIGKFIIIFVMLMGKLGPLTVAFMLAKKEKARFRYPSEDILTG